MTTKLKTTTAPTQGHTPELFKRIEDWVVDFRGRKLFRFIIPGSAVSGLPLGDSLALADRVVSALNACTGLTAEQVAAIPELMEIADTYDHLGGFSVITAKLSAFEATRNALKEMMYQYEPVIECGNDEDGIPDSIILARAALKLTGDCEESK